MKKQTNKEITKEQEENGIEPMLNKYALYNLGNFGIFGTVEIPDNEINIKAKIVIDVITSLMMALEIECPVYENLNHYRTELIIALENNTLTKYDIEIIDDFIQNHFANIEYNVGWCRSRIYLVDNNHIMMNYISEAMDDEQCLLSQYILEFNRLLSSLLFVKRYNNDYAD